MNQTESGQPAALREQNVCSEKRRLRSELEHAANDYSECLRNLSTQARVLPKDIYEQLQARAEAMKLQCDTVRSELERHIAQHGC